jgi:hypothetical protein
MGSFTTMGLCLTKNGCKGYLLQKGRDRISKTRMSIKERLHSNKPSQGRRQYLLDFLDVKTCTSATDRVSSREAADMWTASGLGCNMDPQQQVMQQ